MVFGPFYHPIENERINRGLNDDDHNRMREDYRISDQRRNRHSRPASPTGRPLWHACRAGCCATGKRAKSQTYSSHRHHSLLNNAVVKDTIAALGPAALPAFSNLKPHTPFDCVLSLVETIERAAPDLLVVFGGGSAIDAAKIGSLAAANGARDRDALLALLPMSRARRNHRRGPARSRSLLFRPRCRRPNSVSSVAQPTFRPASSISSNPIRWRPISSSTIPGSARRHRSIFGYRPAFARSIMA